jgi:tubulin polyglutamylase TTLL4
MDEATCSQHDASSIASSSDTVETRYEESVPDADVDLSSIDIEKLPFRRSLFENVPPYIVFHLCNTKPDTNLPRELSAHMKWYLSPVTPALVRHTVENSGYRLMKKCRNWCGSWGKHMNAACFKELREFQKVNHIPGSFQIGRKDRLSRNINHMMIKHGKREFGFVPRTFLLPQDLSLFRQVWQKNGGKEKWIIKPPASARGSGIRVVHRWSQIPKKRSVVVQRYIARPLLIHGAKFDLRLYVLVTSFNPLKIYMYSNGLVRFASVKYNDDINYLSDRFMHLTNYSINKYSASYTDNNCADSRSGHKWTLSSLWSYLEQENMNVSRIWAWIKIIIIKTMIAAEGQINNLIQGNIKSR